MKIITACILTTGILLSANSFAGYHHRHHHGYHHGYHHGWHGYYNHYGYRYHGGYWGPAVVAAPVAYYAGCRYVKRCNHNHCWRKKICNY
jgi:hypothetical protein